MEPNGMASKAYHSKNPILKALKDSLSFVDKIYSQKVHLIQR